MKKKNHPSKKATSFLALLLLAGILLFPLSSATSHLPPGLLKIQEENEKIATEFLSNVTFLIAFLAGVTTILSPCLLPVLPAFFAYTFKEKREITKMTLLFFLGFTPIFLLLGFAATAVGSFFTFFFRNMGAFIMIAGLLLIGLGAYYFFGGGFSLAKINPSFPKKSAWGVLFSGALFGFGWVLCVGPILSGVLIAASVFHNYLTTTLLMVSYSLGVFVPLFLISFFYDKHDLGNSRFMKGKEFGISLFGKKMTLHSTNIIAGSLLILTGLIFILGKGTGFLNASDPWGTKQFFYSLQDWFLLNATAANIAAGAILLLVAGGIWYFLRKKS